MVIGSSNGIQIALDAISGEGPTVIFCAGFNSSRQGNKALALEAWCQQQGRSYIRFDYAAHGDSDGEWAEMTISQWLDDVLAVIDHVKGPVLLVGSSMGGWLALLASLRRSDRVVGLLLIACAADMTQSYPARLKGLDRKSDKSGRDYFEVPNQYDDQEPYRIYQHMIDDGDQYRLLEQPIDLQMPVRLIHGMSDDVVEWQRSVAVTERLNSKDVELRLLKDSDHRLSEPEDLNLICEELAELLAIV